MAKSKYGDYFTGFGGVTIGAKAAGLDVLFGVEFDADLAAVYRRNLGDHVRVEDVTTIDLATLPAVDVFHASPPCTNASVANANAGESPLDLAMARAVCAYIVTVYCLSYRKRHTRKTQSRGCLAQRRGG